MHIYLTHLITQKFIVIKLIKDTAKLYGISYSLIFYMIFIFIQFDQIDGYRGRILIYSSGTHLSHLFINKKN